MTSGDGAIVKSGELAVVIFILSGWVLILVIFVKKWGQIRGVQTVSSYANAQRSNGSSTAAAAASAFTGQVSPTSAAMPPGSVLGVTTTGSTVGPPFFTSVGGGTYSPAGNLLFGSSSNAGSILRSQRSKESDSSSGSHDRNDRNDRPGNSSTMTATAAAETRTSSAKESMKRKKRLEDSIRQYIIIKSQPTAAFTQARVNGLYDQLVTARRTVRSTESHQYRHQRSDGSSNAGSSSAHHHHHGHERGSGGRKGGSRRGSLETRRQVIRSEGDLSHQDVRMNRSAENLLRLDFS